MKKSRLHGAPKKYDIPASLHIWAEKSFVDKLSLIARSKYMTRTQLINKVLEEYVEKENDLKSGK